MKRIYLIGIGPGGIDYLTLQAIEAIKRTDVFLILEKDSDKDKDLLKIRLEVIKRFRDDGTYRIAMATIPQRKKGGRDLSSYKENVSLWRRQKAEVIAELIRKEILDGQIGSILVWGDPSLYDGHIEILDNILKKRMAEFEFEVIPGISSIQILAARHRIPLNAIGGSITITTPRGLRDAKKEDIKNTVVLLDNYLTYKNFRDLDLQIYWGSYLGTEKEILLSGRLREVLDEIIRIRNEAKKNNGWIMETYILRAQDDNE